MWRHIFRMMLTALGLGLATIIAGCDEPTVWNNPHPPTSHKQSIYYGSFAESPKTLDPARSYSTNESLFVAQIYEPPLQYHYLHRPYQLEPLTARELPQLILLDPQRQPLTHQSAVEKAAYSRYTIRIKPNIYYQPHPAFARDAQGKPLYFQLTPERLVQYQQLSQFPVQGSRELTAEDYVYQLKRLADPRLQSPIFGLMSQYIPGLKILRQSIQQAISQASKNAFIDLRQFDLLGVKIIDRYTYQIELTGVYPQFTYWLAMPFFAPIPWEADKFYAQPGMEAKNFTFDWHPVGTGPYMLMENNPNSRMVLQRNPKFRGEYYPSEGEINDAQQGLLALSDQLMPFIDTFIFSLEKESIPRWNKFLQGYYDASAISSDSFDQVIQINPDGTPQLTATMIEQDIRLLTSVGTSIFYLGFNMLDDVVGGYSERARKLRQAIAIAIDYEEFIAIFMNGRGIAAHGPIPPGIFGHLTGELGINPFVYRWQDGVVIRHSLAHAKKLLAEAGYPDGRNAKTGKPLILHYDVPASSGPDDKARFDWMRKQFAKLGIQLHVRATQYNRFQEKMRTGNAQIFFWGWAADYPDPENFLFLLYGPNGKVKYGGENAANYANSHYDKLFKRMKRLPNSPERQAIINQMLQIVRRDTPWVWGFHPKNFVLQHVWSAPVKLNEIANNTLKYQAIDQQLRAEKQQVWNQPIIWPLLILLGFLIAMLIPPLVVWWRRERAT
ncbi:MAG: ABC transporter substrate-binding protein [Gammaproteobacteria bacterium]